MDVSLKLIAFQLINFVIFIGILGFLFNKFIRPLMKKRSDGIKASFDDIEKQKLAIEEIKKEHALQLEQLKISSKLEYEKAVAEAARIKAELKHDAEKEVALFMDKARKEIEQEKQKLLSDVRKEVAMLSMLATKQLIKKEVDDATNKKLVDDFLTELGTIPFKKN